ERTPGGSSGGEAAAISAFCSPGGIGSDGGGSIRLPAHFCGIAGLKPTPGRVSGAGHFPDIVHPGGLLGVAGPMARSARDVRLLFEAMAGYDPADPFSSPVPLREPSVAGVRAGVMEQFCDVPVQSSAREAVKLAAARLESLGVAVEPWSAHGLERAPNLWAFFFDELAAVGKREFFDGREAEAHWTGLEFYERWRDKPPPTASRILECFAERDAMRAALLERMPDVVVAPVCAVPAFRHRERRWEAAGKTIGLFQAMMPLTWVNLLGLPALAIPMTRTADGLPVGVQLIGRPFGEELLLDLAVRMEQA
ncbi:MAG: amidase family protein, partial [Bryobacteraceae bacterium]